MSEQWFVTKNVRELFDIRTRERTYQPIGQQGKPTPDPVPGWVASNISRESEAELIVRAVNAHDELVAALEELTEYATSVTSKCPADCDCQNAKARALLARIKGEAE